MSDAITVAIVASIPASLAVILNLLNRRTIGGKVDDVKESVSGKDGVAADVRANTEKIEAFRVWAEKHDMDHLIESRSEREDMKRRLQRLEEEES